MKIRVMSFNTQHCLNFVTKEIDYDVMAEAINGCSADIIGLNEMRGRGVRDDYEDQTRILAEKLGMYHYFARAIMVDGENPYGNAVLSRYPIENAQTVMIPDPSVKWFFNKYESRCILKADILSPERLSVCVTHFGLNASEQKNAVKTLCRSINDKKCVLMGDFNIEPDSRILKPVRDRMNDTAEMFREKLLSFPSDKPEKKIDYIFTSRDIRVLNADIPPVIASDHRPHIADIEI